MDSLYIFITIMFAYFKFYTILINVIFQNPVRKRDFLSANGDSEDDGGTVRTKRLRLELNDTI